MKYIIISFFLFFFYFRVYSQPLTINWQQCYGGNDGEAGHTMLKVNSGFLLFCGTSSNNDQVTGNHGVSDYWLIRTDLNGNIEWQKCYGGNDNEDAIKMSPCLDGGLLLCGSTWSATPLGGYNGDVYGNHGTSDYWLVKVDSLGTIEWSKCYGGALREDLYSITSTSDSGFFLAGWSNSIDGDVTGNHGLYDAWIVKINHSGIIKWEKSYGGSNIDWANNITSTNDGGFIFCGVTYSNDGDALCNFHGGCDVWVVKGDSLGNIEWQKCYGGIDYEGGNSILTTPDGGYIFMGVTASNDGDVTENHGGGDIWIVKIDHEGNLIWQKCFGGSKDELGYFIKPGNAGSFFIGGATNSNDGDVSGNNSLPYDVYYDMWLIKISSEGTLLWQQCLGGDYVEVLVDLSELLDGQMMLLGSTNTSNNSGDVQCDHHGPGTNDVWLLSVKDTTEVGVDPEKDENISIISYPNPAADEVTIQYSLRGNNLNPFILIYNELGTILKLTPLLERKGKIQWNTGNIGSGVYYYKFCNNQFTKTGKIIILKQ
ncbi:MAG: T9SS type A sorting domain-containing protein [Bacteroidales bacterium]|jgi:hypothetical protein|nr:T9SS type A sorting domain-containing protein [Bacteroidales bacterium]